jgi:dGTPase
MIYTHSQLEKDEKKRLQSYAVLSEKSLGREYPETADDTRTCFQRDRDRILHSKAFRRLAGKTQVFVANMGDHYRTRMSHSLEVAQVARDLARSLGLNEDLVESIALAHDLGHPPFGHAGEEQLDKCMQKFGLNFEHNEQSKRVVDVLEDRYPNFPGLNLSLEVLEGLEKHQSHYDRRGQEISGKTLEAQVVDLADEIAYHNHDLDDGMRGGVFNIRALGKLTLWQKAEKKTMRLHGDLSLKYLRHRTISTLISMMIDNVVDQTERNIRKLKIRSPQDAVKQSRNAAAFSSTFYIQVQELREFLYSYMYQGPLVHRQNKRGQRIIKFVFNTLHARPQLLPDKVRERVGSRESLEIVVKDFVAGMTDAYALDFYEKYR